MEPSRAEGETTRREEGDDTPQPSASTSISFKFQKQATQSRLKLSNESSSRGNDAASKDFVLSLEGKAIQSTKPKPKEKEYIVPFIGKNRWRLPPGQGEKNGSLAAGDGGTAGGRTEDEVQLEREAAEAVLRDIQEAQLRASGDGGDSAEPVIPLLLQNKPPTVEGREGDELADVDLRPEQSTMDDYESMPIGKFGEAVLKGMGWKKGEAIGRTNKGLIEPIEFIPRLGGLGLGATPRAPPPEKRRRIKKPGEVAKKVQGPYVDKDGRVKHVKTIGEEIPEQPLQGFVAGNFARVLSGPHRDLQGKIISVDDVTARVVLRMAINSQLMTFSQHHLELMSRETYVQGGRSSGRSLESQSNSSLRSDKSEKKLYGLITKEDRMKNRNVENEKRTTHRTEDDDRGASMPSSKRIKPSDDYYETKSSITRDRTKVSGTLDRQQMKREEDLSRRDHHRDQESEKSKSKKKKAKEKREDEVTRETNWLASKLRVRIVDQKYKNGRFYNTKVVVVDVVSLGTCLCRTESGKLLEGVTQSMVETVIPRTPSASVMLVGGKRKREGRNRMNM